MNSPFESKMTNAPYMLGPDLTEAFKWAFENKISPAEWRDEIVRQAREGMVPEADDALIREGLAYAREFCDRVAGSEELSADDWEKLQMAHALQAASALLASRAVHVGEGRWVCVDCRAPLPEGAGNICAKCAHARAVPPAGQGEADFAEADETARLVEPPLPPVNGEHPHATLSQASLHNLARAYLALRAGGPQDGREVTEAMVEAYLEAKHGGYWSEMPPEQEELERDDAHRLLAAALSAQGKGVEG